MIDEFIKLTDFKSLFELREKLKKDIEANKGWTVNNDTEKLKTIHECSFWLSRLEARIKYLELKGFALDRIETP